MYDNKQTARFAYPLRPKLGARLFVRLGGLALDFGPGGVQLKLTLDRPLNAKQLRQELPRIVERVRRGEKFTVSYRSRPAFRIVPMTGSEHDEVPLEEDPLYRAEPVGYSGDGFTSRDHDQLLYGKSHR